MTSPVSDSDDTDADRDTDDTHDHADDTSPDQPLVTTATRRQVLAGSSLLPFASVPAIDSARATGRQIASSDVSVSTGRHIYWRWFDSHRLYGNVGNLGPHDSLYAQFLIREQPSDAADTATATATATQNSGDS